MHFFVQPFIAIKNCSKITNKLKPIPTYLHKIKYEELLKLRTYCLNFILIGKNTIASNICGKAVINFAELFSMFCIWEGKKANDRKTRRNLLC